MKKKIPFSYNAPVTLTFSILCVLVLLTDRFILDGTLIPAIFTAPACMTEKNGFNWNYVLDYVRLFTHVLGHADWTHLLGNLAYILLLGPLMEERYGSKMLALMIVVTSLVTGVLNVCLIPSVLLGASGICFMLIVLSSLNVITRNKIPLTFVFLVAVYIAKEFSGAKTAETSNISVVAHIAGIMRFPVRISCRSKGKTCFGQGSGFSGKKDTCNFSKKYFTGAESAERLACKVGKNPSGTTCKNRFFVAA